METIQGRKLFAEIRYTLFPPIFINFCQICFSLLYEAKEGLLRGWLGLIWASKGYFHYVCNHVSMYYSIWSKGSTYTFISFPEIFPPILLLGTVVYSELYCTDCNDLLGLHNGKTSILKVTFPAKWKSITSFGIFYRELKRDSYTLPYLTNRHARLLFSKLLTCPFISSLFWGDIEVGEEHNLVM